MEKSAPTIRTLAAALVAFNVAGNYLLSLGMREVGETVSLSPVAYLRALGNVWVIAGVVLLIGWLVAQLALLSWADLSYILPITATAYVLAAVLGAAFLHEHVSLARWAGVLLICAGVAIVARTKPRTVPGLRDET